MNTITDETRGAWPDGELCSRLVARGVIAKDAIDRAARMSREGGVTLAATLVSGKLVRKQLVYEELASIYGVPYIDLDSYIYDPKVISLVPEKMSRELKVFPLFAIGNSLTVAMVDPSDITIMDRVAAVSKHNVDPCLASPEDLQHALNRAFGGGGEVREFLESMGDEALPAVRKQETPETDLHSSESPVSKLVNLIIEQAVRDRASDIHVDPGEDTLKIRFRIDGVLYDIPAPPRHLHSFIISRLKVMSNMDIAESRSPQDGSFSISVDNRRIETRVSSIPTINGENMAIRIQDTRSASITLENLGIPPRLLGSLEQMIHGHHGMVVVTGPTGSGKSTTLYAMLSKAHSSEHHIVSIEDPVERRMESVSQIQINEKAGLTFALALRSILRQDPDIIMVGEIRDQETAQLAVRAALTGHMVFSTIHTNDAPGAVTRLINMGIEPFLLASSLTGSIAQRLARRICQECKIPAEIPAPVRQRLTGSGIALPDSGWKGKGCSHCRNTGYSGRIAMFELMPVTNDMAEMISANVPAGQLRARARKDGMSSVLEDGIEKVGGGVTTIEEVLRVCELETVGTEMFVKPAAAVEPGRGGTRPPPAPAAEPAPVQESDIGRTGPLDLDDYKVKVAHWLARKRR
ncbi:MAG: type II secretion system protein GspE [Verrucomicrobia bacterium]|nr:type II secretion system protein GspE [Verrucomicrobiota bacterium]